MKLLNFCRKFNFMPFCEIWFLPAAFYAVCRSSLDLLFCWTHMIEPLPEKCAAALGETFSIFSFSLLLAGGCYEMHSGRPFAFSYY